MELRQPLGNLGRAAIRILKDAYQEAVHPEEVSDEVLRGRIDLRNSVYRLTQNEDFRAFHEDGKERIRQEKDALVNMDVTEFVGPKGIELKGEIRGRKKVFGRLASIITGGDAAELKLNERLKKFRQEEARKK